MINLFIFNFSVNALDEDLNLGELSSSLDREFAMDSDVSETNAYNSGFSSNSKYAFGCI